MNFPDAVKSVYRNFVNFSDRAPRSEYWWFFLFTIIGSVVIGIIESALGLGQGAVTTAPGEFSANFAGGPLSMIWSLVKVLLFVTVIAVLTLGAGYLLDTGGGIRLAVAGWEFTIGPMQAVVLGIVLFVTIWLAMKLLGLLGATVRGRRCRRRSARPRRGTQREVDIFVTGG